jgi:hypothetical protein
MEYQKGREDNESAHNEGLARNRQFEKDDLETVFLIEIAGARIIGIHGSHPGAMGAHAVLRHTMGIITSYYI